MANNKFLHEYIAAPRGEAAGYLAARDITDPVYVQQVAARATAKLEELANKNPKYKGLLSEDKDEFIDAKIAANNDLHVTDAISDSYEEIEAEKQAVKEHTQNRLSSVPVEIKAVPLLKETLSDLENPTSPRCDELKLQGSPTVNNDGSVSFNYDAKMVNHGDAGESHEYVRVSLVKDNGGNFTLYKSESYKTEYFDQEGKHDAPTVTNSKAIDQVSAVDGLKKVSGKDMDERIVEKAQRDAEEKASEAVVIKPNINAERAGQAEKPLER